MRKLSVVLLAILSTFTFAEWTYVDKVDLFTDEDSSYIYTKSTLTRGVTYGDASLVVRCTVDAGLDLYINWSEYLGRDERYTVKVRLDKEPPFDSFLWGSSTDGTASFAPVTKVNELVDLMKPKSTILFGVEDYQGSAVQASFSLTGFTAAYNQFKCIK